MQEKIYNYPNMVAILGTRCLLISEVLFKTLVIYSPPFTTFFGMTKVQLFRKRPRLSTSFS